MKQDGIGRETNRKRLLMSQNKLRVGGRGRETGMGFWTLGRVCAMVSAVKCVNLAIHRPVPLGLIIHYMFIKKNKKSESLHSFSRVIAEIICGTLFEILVTDLFWPICVRSVFTDCVPLLS